MGTPLNVLIIEDSEDDTLLIVRELRRVGYEPIYERVETAEAMETALDKNIWDIILSDYVMPHFSGLDALRLMQTKGLDLPFIIVSGLIGEETDVEVIKAGAHDYVMKGNLSRLNPAVKRELREAEGRKRRRQTEEALYESQRNLEAIVETVPSLIVLTDPDGRIILFNHAFEELTGYKREEVFGKTIQELFLPSEWVPIIQKRFADPYAPEVYTPHENPWITKSGEERLIEWRCAVTPSPKNGTPCILGTGIDITERKQAEEALRESEHSYRTLAENLPGIVYRVFIRENNRIKFFNKMSQAMTGYKDDELEAGEVCSIESMILQKDRPKVVAEVKRAILDNRPFTIEYRLRRKDGNTRYFLEKGTPIYGKDRNPLYIDGVIFDITERKKAEEALQASEEQYRTLVENINIGVYRNTSGPKGRFLQANPAIVKIFGYDSIEEFIQISVSDLYQNPEDRKLFVEEILKNGFIKDKELRLKKKDGTPIWASCSATIKYDQKGDIQWIDGVIEDITERKKLEAQLFHAQKMEAVGQLAGGVAHDFNNILTAIIGYVHFLKMGLKDDDPLRTYIDHIGVSTERAANLTQSLLAFSRKQIINPRPVHLNEIIRNIQKLLFRVIGEDIELKTIMTDQDITTMADPSQIEQVLMNLATNARDAMPEGGLLTIETDVMTLDEEYIKTHGYGKPGKYAYVSITDTGMGMDEETKGRIFEPFFTTKEFGKGTGLGLAMVYGIIKQHNGYINVYSEPGKGTTFKIYLPLIKAEVEEVEPEVIHTLTRGTETLLLAEDDTEVRLFTKAMLEKFGYTVIEAFDGEDAIKKFMDNKDRIQLLLIDVIMPRMNGKEVYKEIKKIIPDVKILFMSGYTASIIHKKGIIGEGLDFILKPIFPKELLKKVREVIDK